MIDQTGVASQAAESNKQQRTTDHNRTLTTETPVVLEPERDLIDSEEVQKQMKAWPSKQASKHKKFEHRSGIHTQPHQIKITLKIS